MGDFFKRCVNKICGKRGEMKTFFSGGGILGRQSPRRLCRQPPLYKGACTNPSLPCVRGGAAT